VRIASLLLAAVLGLAASLAGAAFYDASFERKPTPADLTALGRRLFSEPALSASGRMSCASCHSPAHAYGPPNARAVQLGGADLKSPGLRAVPSLRYRAFTPAFDLHFRDADGNDSTDQGPAGGFGWDGRAGSAHEQAAGPLLSPFEMANASAAQVVARLRTSPSAGAFKATFGPHALDDEARAWKGLLWALEVFQQDPAEFAPFSSKYDAVLRGQARLTAAEQRGLSAFNDAGRGNCAACHTSGAGRNGSPLFTDFGLINLGLPRNPRIAANTDPAFFDLGLAGPLRQDLAADHELCGRFKAPSLRNVATRSVFFHNGVFTRLDEAVRFYAERDHRPERYYGRSRQPNDLPPNCRAAINAEPPFGHASKPAFSEAEVQDIVAFLRTLTDGFTRLPAPVPPQPSARAQPATGRPAVASPP